MTDTVSQSIEGIECEIKKLDQEIKDLKQKKETFVKLLDQKIMEKYSIVISKEWSDYVCEQHQVPFSRAGKFRASNGIIIACGGWIPGFENPQVDMLYTSDGRHSASSILGKPWIPDEGRAKFIEKHARIVEAIAELKQKYEASLEPDETLDSSKQEPVCTPTSVSDKPQDVPTKTADRFRTSVETMETLGFDRKAAIRALLDCKLDLVDAISALSK